MTSPRTVRPVALAATLILALFGAPAAAQEPEGHTHHVRCLRDGSLDSSELLAEARRRSPTVQGLIDALDGSDVVVYVELKKNICTRKGMLRMISCTRGFRYFLISIELTNDLPDRMMWLGHELRHAVEIAEHRTIRSEADMRGHYLRVGHLTGPSHFETDAAIEAGEQVLAEVRGITWARR